MPLHCTDQCVYVWAARLVTFILFMSIYFWVMWSEVCLWFLCYCCFLFPLATKWFPNRFISRMKEQYFSCNSLVHIDTDIEYGVVITRQIFYQILTKLHPIDRSIGREMCLLRVVCDLKLIYIPLQSTQCCMEYRVILDRVIAAL